MELPTDQTVLTAMLTDATTQYHALMTGTAAKVVVDQNGERVEFTPAKKTDLYNYISQLQAALVPVGTPVARSGPLQFFF